MVPLAGKSLGIDFILSSPLQIVDLPPRLPERDLAGTPYVPVYVMLPVSYFLALLFH